MSLKRYSGFELSGVTVRISKIIDTLITDPIKVLTNHHLYAAIGFVSLLPLVKNVLVGLYDLLRSKSLNDISRIYKPTLNASETSSWVAVTGATGGIGKSFCQIFARLGFNIIAISRDQTKLDNLETELIALNSSIKVKKVRIDFSKHYTKEDIEEIVINQIRDLDVSILVNNVAEGGCFVFHELNSRKIYNLLHTNICSQIFMTQGLMPHFIERSKTLKTGIINISSNMGTEVFLPYFSIYAASKAFNNHFSLALASEYPQIDILAARPGRTKTSMNPNAKTTPEVQVKAILRFLGVKKETTGTFRSYIEANYGPSLYWAVKRFIRKGVYSTYQTKYRNDMLRDADSF